MIYCIMGKQTLVSTFDKKTLTMHEIKRSYAYSISNKISLLQALTRKHWLLVIGMTESLSLPPQSLSHSGCV